MLRLLLIKFMVIFSHFFRLNGFHILIKRVEYSYCEKNKVEGWNKPDV